MNDTKYCYDEWEVRHGLEIHIHNAYDQPEADRIVNAIFRKFERWVKVMNSIGLYMDDLEEGSVFWISNMAFYVKEIVEKPDRKQEVWLVSDSNIGG